ncbi:MAG: hypothetical protein E7646_05230 [Ruminococcaceae bacterium]|nr:hypothetical protein [Oscillospiraceae bacterium]
MIKEILVDFTDCGKVICSENELVYRGESLSTCLVIRLPEKLRGYRLYLDFEKPDSSKMRSAVLETEEGCARYLIPTALLDQSGELIIQPVLCGGDGFVRKLESLRLTVKEAVCAQADVAQAEDFFSEAQKALDRLMNVPPARDGVTFTPFVSSDGILSWSNDGGLENPSSVRIRGEDGAAPQRGVDYFTEEDVSAMVDSVVNVLGGYPVYGVVSSDNKVLLKGALDNGSYSVSYERVCDNGVSVPLRVGNLTIDDTVYHSVTFELTNCSADITTPYVKHGEYYNTIITANEGYELESVRVTVGGAEEETALGFIDVVATGDIVITAVAR